MKLVEGEHYYCENGLYVFTSLFLLLRGYCCDSGCRHCPYDRGTGWPRDSFRVELPQAYAAACAAIRAREQRDA